MKTKKSLHEIKADVELCNQKMKRAQNNIKELKQWIIGNFVASIFLCLLGFFYRPIYLLFGIITIVVVLIQVVYIIYLKKTVKINKKVTSRYKTALLLEKMQSRSNQGDKPCIVSGE